MTRIYSAINNSESVLLDQLESDINEAKNSNPKELDTEEYKIVVDGRDILIHDKVHNESTKVVETPEGFKLEEDKPKKMKFKFKL